MGPLRAVKDLEKPRTLMARHRAWWLWGAPRTPGLPSQHSHWHHFPLAEAKIMACSISVSNGCWARCQFHRHLGSWGERGCEQGLQAGPARAPSVLSQASDLAPYPHPTPKTSSLSARKKALYSILQKLDPHLPVPQTSSLLPWTPWPLEGKSRVNCSLPHSRKGGLPAPGRGVRPLPVSRGGGKWERRRRHKRKG